MSNDAKPHVLIVGAGEYDIEPWMGAFSLTPGGTAIFCHLHKSPVNRHFQSDSSRNRTSSESRTY
jgi:hypothetical protein